ncbi:MAG: hypothetical protein AAFQ91_07590 [Cyanobacteria bacterium J06621_15]
MKKTAIKISTLAALSITILIPNTANAQTVIEESSNSQLSTVVFRSCPFIRCHPGL